MILTDRKIFDQGSYTCSMCDLNKCVIPRLEKKNSYLKAEIQRYKKITSNSNNKRLHTDEHLNNVIDDDDYLHNATGMNREEFEWILKRFEKSIYSEGQKSFRIALRLF